MSYIHNPVTLPGDWSPSSHIQKMDSQADNECSREGEEQLLGNTDLTSGDLEGVWIRSECMACKVEK